MFLTKRSGIDLHANWINWYQGHEWVSNLSYKLWLSKTVFRTLKWPFIGQDDSHGFQQKTGVRIYLLHSVDDTTRYETRECLSLNTKSLFFENSQAWLSGCQLSKKHKKRECLLPFLRLLIWFGCIVFLGIFIFWMSTSYYAQRYCKCDANILIMTIETIFSEIK